jgi:NMD protein affecting ribosome stability and mRNA decay
MTRSTTTPPSLPPRGSDRRYRDRIFDDPRHDPYQAKGKYKEPTVCSGCGAAFHDGRWTWAAAAEGAARAECPACHRIRDRQPAGFITLAGAGTADEREALVRLVRNVEKHEKAEHPLHRIIAIEQDADEMRVTTTDTHLPQRIGESIRHARKGTLGIVYGQDEYGVRVHWQR